jgi:hypothetical protein
MDFLTDIFRLNPGNAAAGGSGFLGGLNKFLTSPTGQLTSLLGFGGLQSLAAGKREDKNLAAEQAMLDQRLAQERELAALDAALKGQQLESNERVQAAGMAGNSPLQFQMDRMRADLANRFFNGSFRPSVSAPKGIPMGSVNLPTFNSPFLTPESLANAEVPYFQQQGALNPSLEAPDLSSMGYGSAGTGATDKIAASRVDQMARSKERQRAIQQALQSGSSTARNRMGGK